MGIEVACLTLRKANDSKSKKSSETHKLDRFGATQIGNDYWWTQIQQKGTPLININAQNSQQCLVTFLWRDPYGSEKYSTIQKVYIDVNCVTEHQSFNPPSLERIEGTDVWYWQVQLEKQWRGSYRLIPVTVKQLAVIANDEEQIQTSQRRWWRSLLNFSIPDPLNRMSPDKCLWGMQYSALHLPEAPKQSAWQVFDQTFNKATEKASHDIGNKLAKGKLQTINWHSKILHNTRQIWIYTPLATTNDNHSLPSHLLDERPLIVLFDGEFWSEKMPIFSAIDEETFNGALPQSVYVLIDSLNPQIRSQELTCNPKFFKALNEELIPTIQKLAPHSKSPQKSIIAGQSFGGLAAMYAGLSYPEKFGCVISQSGSFWWPHISLMKNPISESLHSTEKNVKQESPQKKIGWLTEKIHKKYFPDNKTQILQQVGNREIAINKANQQLKKALINAGYQVTFKEFSGGHDRLCWRGELIEGLKYFLSNQVLR